MTDELARTLAREALDGDHDSFLVFKDRIEELGDHRLIDVEESPNSWIDEVTVTAEYAGVEHRQFSDSVWLRLPGAQFHLYRFGIGGFESSFDERERYIKFGRWFGESDWSFSYWTGEDYIFVDPRKIENRPDPTTAAASATSKCWRISAIATCR